MSNNIPPADQPNESSNVPRKWYQSCGGQIMMTGCAAPLLLVVFAVISIFTTCGGNSNESTCGAAAIGFVIPVVVIFVTVPLLIIGGIVLGVSRPAQVIQVQEKSDNQESPIVSNSEKVVQQFPTFSVLSSLLSLWPFYIYRIPFEAGFFVYLQFLGPMLAIIFAVTAWRKKERFMVLALTLAGILAIPYLLLPLLTFFIF
ncbi:MAG: hypothetical protein ACO3P3_02365 [Candidatus Nanopelagicales bacterium]